MDKLEDYIKNRREDFDSENPPEGHASRFEAILNKEAQAARRPQRLARKVHPASILSVAACIAIIVAVVIRFAPPSPDAYRDNSTEEINMSEEFRATNDYYSGLMESQIAGIMCKLPGTDNNNQKQLMQDIKQMMEANRSFVSDIAASDSEELAIYYLVKHYETNLRILENINEKLGKYSNC